MIDDVLRLGRLHLGVRRFYFGLKLTERAELLGLHFEIKIDDSVVADQRIDSSMIDSCCPRSRLQGSWVRLLFPNFPITCPRLLCKFGCPCASCLQLVRLLFPPFPHNLLMDRDINELVGDDIQHDEQLNQEELLREPFVGMMFESMTEARQYYVEYGKRLGFQIRTRSTSRNKPRSDDVTGATFVCAREGKLRKLAQEGVYNVQQESLTDENEKGKTTKKKRSSSTVKTGCMAYMRVLNDVFTMKWKVTQFENVHNHNLITPSKRVKMRPFKDMPTAARDLAEAFSREGLSVGKVPAIFGGDYATFDSRDCWNHMAKMRQSSIEVGDAVATLNYFRKKLAESPRFYYAVQYDGEGRAANMFWVDGRSRDSYRHFGDVVTFDTTYRTNKYNMPFAPFTGVNHHNQSILFGCVLLCDETEETFCWVFNVWLEAMGGRHPISIITDQDLAMKAAIAKVFPNTRHRLCIWHIKKKFAEKLSHVYFEKSDLQKDMTRCIHWTWKEKDFEEQWQRLVIKYNLEENEWLQHLYHIRSEWVPVYNRQTFFAGMSTTGRSEGTNSFFDQFVNPRTTLTDFVASYDRAVKKIVLNENNEDFESEHKERVVERHLRVLRHAAEVFTRNIFVKLKHEWDEAWNFKIDEETLDDDRQYFHMKTRNGCYACPQQFVVQLNKATHAGTCSCKYYEFSGLICRHVMKAFQRLDLDMIPDSFICERWRKRANTFRVMYESTFVTFGDTEQSEEMRLNHMCQEMTRLACRSAPFNEAYVAYMEGVKYTSDKVEAVLKTVMLNRASGGASMVASNEPEVNSDTHLSQIKILDPKVSQTKGRKKDAKGKEKVQASGRIKSSIELSTQKKKRLCRCMKMKRHDKRNCPENPKNLNKRSIESESSEDMDDGRSQMDEDVESSDD